jgi:hypothetical protein
MPPQLQRSPDQPGAIAPRKSKPQDHFSQVVHVLFGRHRSLSAFDQGGLCTQGTKIRFSH